MPQPCLSSVRNGVFIPLSCFQKQAFHDSAIQDIIATKLATFYASSPQFFLAKTQLVLTLYPCTDYDVNKLPLGKLSNNTITKGYQALKDLSELMDDASLAQSVYDLSYAEATEHLSNSFYSLIPHAFGRNRPPIINNQDMLKKEVDLLDSLSDMKDASNISKYLQTCAHASISLICWMRSEKTAKGRRGNQCTRQTVQGPRHGRDDPSQEG